MTACIKLRRMEAKRNSFSDSDCPNLIQNRARFGGRAVADVQRELYLTSKSTRLIIQRKIGSI
jgi:hypothetical protein